MNQAPHLQFNSLNFFTNLTNTQKAWQNQYAIFRDKDVAKVQRFDDAFQQFVGRVKTASLNDTPLSAFQKGAAILSSINTYLERFDVVHKTEQNLTDVLIDFDHLADSILELLPQIRVMESYLEIQEIAKSNLSNIGVIKTELKTLKETAENEIKTISNLKIDAVNLSQLLAGKVLKNDFKIRADIERWSARYWTIGTGVSAALTIGVLLYTFFFHIKDEALDYSLLSSKILLTATLGLVAKWCSKRASRHLLEESRYHRLAVNMETIKSFISPLDTKTQETVISAVALKIFTEDGVNDVSTEFEPPAITDVIKNIFNK